MTFSIPPVVIRDFGRAIFFGIPVFPRRTCERHTLYRFQIVVHSFDRTPS